MLRKPPPDNQELWRNTKLVVPDLHLFQISPLFREETARIARVVTSISGTETKDCAYMHAVDEDMEVLYSSITKIIIVGMIFEHCHH